MDQSVNDRSTWVFKIFCCMYDQNEEENEANQTSLINRVSIQPEESIKEKNELRLLGDPTESTYQALVRLTQKNFFVDLLQRKSRRPLDESSSAKVYFSQFDRGIKVQSLELGRAIPEAVLKYLTQRCCISNNIVVWDAYCDCGAFAIQMALQEELLYVVGMNEHKTQIKYSMHNAGVYSVKSEVEFIEVGFESVDFNPKVKPDVLYIHPQYTSDEPFSLQKNIQPSLQKILERALRTCRNIILVLPGWSSAQEITLALTFYFQMNQMELNKFEIQSLQIDGMLSNYVVYLGQVAKVNSNICRQVNHQDEAEFIVNYLCDKDQGNLHEFYQAIKKIIHEYGLRKVLDQAIEARNVSQGEMVSALDYFLSMSVKKGLLTKREVQDIGDNSDILQETPKYQQISMNDDSFNPCIAKNYQNYQQRTKSKQKTSPHLISFQNVENSFECNNHEDKSLRTVLEQVKADTDEDS